MSYSGHETVVVVVAVAGLLITVVIAMLQGPTGVVVSVEVLEKPIAPAVAGIRHRGLWPSAP